MRTDFTLLAIYEKPLIPLEVFCHDILGIALQTGRNRIAAGTFPVPLTRTGIRTTVHVDDAARYIDSCRERASDDARPSRYRHPSAR